MNARFIMVSLAMALCLGACADDDGRPRTFANNDLELATGNSAKLGCTCLFVMNMSEEFCREWVKASPDVAKLTIDRTNKRVESSAFVSWAQTAHYIDEKRGCVLE